MANTFQVSRDIFDNGIFKHPNKFRLFFYIFGMARWDQKPLQLGKVKICRGQYLRSYRKLQEDTEYIENNTVKNISMGSIKRYIDELIHEDRLTVKETELGTLFTVTNYDIYQSFTNENKKGLEQQMNSIGTANEQQMNNRKTDNTDKTDKNEELSQEKTPASSAHNQCIKIFDNYYNQRTGLKYDWSGKEIKSMQGVLVKLTKQVKVKTITEPLPEQVTKAFEFMINNINDKWILENLSVSNINSKFNEILNKIKNGNSSGSESKQNRLDRELKALDQLIQRVAT